MNGPDDSSDVSVSVPPPLPQGMNPIGQGVMLGYERPRVEREVNQRSPLWADISIPAAIVYAGFLLIVELFLATGSPIYASSQIFIPLVITAPIGIAALVINVFGHFSPQGRKKAGPAMWIVACSPGFGTAVHMLIAWWRRRSTFDYVVAGGTAIIIINAIVVAVLNRRILKATYVEMDPTRAANRSD